MSKKRRLPRVKHKKTCEWKYRLERKLWPFKVGWFLTGHPVYLIRQISEDKIFGFLFTYTLYKKKCFNMNFILIWHVLNFSGQNISADEVFGSNSDFRQFCPQKFCPIKGNMSFDKIFWRTKFSAEIQIFGSFVSNNFVR